MMGVSITGTDKTLANLKGAKNSLPAAQERGVRKGVALVERALKLELSQKGEMDAFWGKQGSSGDGLAVRTGRTRAGITGATLRHGTEVVGVVGSKDKHLKDHEEGATIAGGSPGGFHRIPTAAAKTAAGVDRNAGRSIRNIPGAFLFRSSAGSLWAAVRTFGSGATMVRGKERRAAFKESQAARVGASTGGLMLLYLLVRSVTLRGRNIFARVRREQQGPVVEAVGREVAVVVQRANQ